MKALILMTLWLTTFTVNADLIVLADLGGHSTQPYFEAIAAEADTVPSVIQLPEQFTTASLFPVVTPELSLGTVQYRPLNLPGLMPFFIIGDDALSRQWLTARLAYLQQLDAMGFVVNVASESALDDLRHIARGLQLQAAAGGDLARRLQLEHYPVLVSAEGIQQ